MVVHALFNIILTLIIFNQCTVFKLYKCVHEWSKFYKCAFCLGSRAAQHQDKEL